MERDDGRMFSIGEDFAIAPNQGILGYRNEIHYDQILTTTPPHFPLIKRYPLPSSETADIIPPGNEAEREWAEFRRQYLQNLSNDSRSVSPTAPPNLLGIIDAESYSTTHPFDRQRYTTPATSAPRLSVLEVLVANQIPFSNLLF